MKGLVRAASSLLLLLVVGALAASPVAADKPDENSPVHLALADSWSTGVGASAPSEGYVPQLYEALKEDFNCHGNAPADASSGCKHLLLVNVGRGGGATPTLIANQLPQAVALLEERNANNQKNDNVELVTIQIGGNDVTNPIIAACLGGLTPACAATIQAEFAAFQADLDQALSTLREAAGPDTPIVIGTYDNPIPTCFLGAVPGASQLGAIVLEGFPPVVPLGLHDIIRAVAADYDVQVAEVFGDLAPQDWVGGNDCLHPDDSGYDKVTQAYLETLGLA
jgi:lysophospholipase L1-like esterase